jgi:hypothetical protein
VGEEEEKGEREWKERVNVEKRAKKERTDAPQQATKALPHRRRTRNSPKKKQSRIRREEEPSSIRSCKLLERN